MKSCAYLALVRQLYRLQRPYILIVVVAIVVGLARIVAVDGELLGGARDPVIMEYGVDQGRRAVRVAVEQRLYRGGRRAEQRRHGGRFAVNDLRRRTHRRAVPDLDLRRGRRRWRRRHGRRAYGALIAEQLVGRGLIAGALAAVVEDVLVMVAAVLVVVQRLGLARVHLREGRLRLIVLRIAGRMLEGAAGSRGGRFAGPGRGSAGRAGRAGSRRGSSQLMLLNRVERQIVLVVAVLVQAASNEQETDVKSARSIATSCDTVSRTRDFSR